MPKEIDAYFRKFPKDVQRRLKQMRSAIRGVVPKAEEKMSYGIPAFYLNGKYVAYYAAFKSHIGFYPIPKTLTAFKAALSKYKQGKGSVQFPFESALPLPLIKKIVRARLKAIRAEVAKKPKKA